MRCASVLSVELSLFSPNHRPNGRLGRFLFFCELRAGETFDQISEMFPKFEKNKMRVVTQPWKVLQGLVQKTPAVLSSWKARDVRDSEERRSGGPEGML